MSLRAPTDGTQNLLLNFAVTRGFTQVVEWPARKNNLLYVVLSSEPIATGNVDVIQPFSTSDHCQVVFSVFTDCSFCVPEQEVDLKYYDWSKDHYKAMSGYITGIYWPALLTT